MSNKPRVKAPKQRATQRRAEDEARRKRLLMFGVGGLAALAAIVGIVALLGLGGGEPSAADVRAELEAAGCTLVAKKAQPGEHTLQPDDTAKVAKWNTDPPTSGPHFGFDNNQNLGTVIWGAYTEPLQLARVVHNLEHGGVYIFYGDKVRPAVVEQLREFYDRHEKGTLLAPYPKLGNQIALGAWVASDDGETENGYLAKCNTFDEDAFSSFFAAFQFEGPERFPADSLLPGSS
jgi:hypothetical protein